MKKTKKYLKIILGCLMIALALNMFFKNMDLIPSGVFGFAIVYASKTKIDLSIVLFAANLFFFLISCIFLNKHSIKKLILPFVLVPALVYLTQGIDTIVDLYGVDKLLISIYGGALIGMGASFIYKENRYASGADVLMLVSKLIDNPRRYIANYCLDMVWIILAIHLYGLEGAMYTAISIILIESISRRAYLGVSDSKVFYIITKKESDVRDFIINELNYDLTSFDAKGGFLKAKNQVIMCVIPTKDYYRLREGVKQIDPKAFISITDSYEVINPNRHIDREKSKL